MFLLINIARDRRKAKAVGDFKSHNKLDAEFQKQARKNKEAYLNNQCNIIQKHNQNSKILYKTRKGITGKKASKLCVLKNKKKQIIIEEKDIKERRKEYREKLYKTDGTIKEVFTATTFVEEPIITEAEVANAIKEILSGKSPGIDEIPAELIKITGEEGTKILAILCIKIWETCEWPIDWKRSIYMPLSKKGDISECSNHQAMALISHASKVLLKIIQKRIQPYCRI